MKKLISTGLAAIFLIAFAAIANARMMTGGFSNSATDWDKVVEHTAKGEQEGKALWDKLQSRQIQCTGLSNDDFDALGEYFMGTMMGGSHAAMNAMMMQMQGERGEEQIHIVMGKRLSGCDTAAVFPAGTTGWTPMMQMMWGGWSSPDGFNSAGNNTMMNFGYGFGFFGWILMILWWALIIGGIAALIKWLMGRGGTAARADKSALDILRERYARGEIDKPEFEDKKRDLA